MDLADARRNAEPVIYAPAGTEAPSKDDCLKAQVRLRWFEDAALHVILADPCHQFERAWANLELAASGAGIHNGRAQFQFLSFGSSTCTEASTTSIVSAPGVRCFLPGTIFEPESGGRMFVEDASVGQLLCNCRVGGVSLRIARMRRHEEDDQSLVELATASARLVVTASHRVLVPKGNSATPALAGELAQGDRVVINGGQAQELESVKRFGARTEVFEFQFEPDEPVAAYHAADAEALWPDQILTMGRSPPKHRGGRTSNARRALAQRAAESQKVTGTTSSYSSPTRV